MGLIKKKKTLTTDTLGEKTTQIDKPEKAMEKFSR